MTGVMSLCVHVCSSFVVVWVIQGQASVKKEPQDEEQEEISAEESKKFKKPKTETVDAERLSPGDGHSSKHTVSTQVMHTLPPILIMCLMV